MFKKRVCTGQVHRTILLQRLLYFLYTCQSLDLILVRNKVPGHKIGNIFQGFFSISMGMVDSDFALGGKIKVSTYYKREECE